MSAETAVLSRLLRGMARRSGYWRRQRKDALRKRDQVLRDTRAAVGALGSALGLSTVSHPSELRLAALRLRESLVEARDELRRSRETLAVVLGERCDVPCPEALLLGAGLEDLSHEELRGIVMELRTELETSHELNQGWVRYGQRVRERRSEERRELEHLRKQTEAWLEDAKAARAWRLEVTPRLAELGRAVERLAQRPEELRGRAQELWDVADALLSRPGSDGSPYNRWLEAEQAEEVTE